MKTRLVSILLLISILTSYMGTAVPSNPLRAQPSGTLGEPDYLYQGMPPFLGTALPAIPLLMKTSGVLLEYGNLLKDGRSGIATATTINAGETNIKGQDRDIKGFSGYTDLRRDNADGDSIMWIGGEGSWSDSTKWSGGVVPNSTNPVIIASGTNDIVHVTGGYSVKSVTIGSSGDSLSHTLHIQGGGSLNVTDNIVNYGTLTLDNNYPSLSAGTLNNYGILNFNATDGYYCTLSASLNNTSGGTVNVNSVTTFNKNPGTYINDGTFSIISGKTLTVNNGAPIFNQNSSNFSCSGTLSLSNVTFTYSGGTLAQLNMSSGTFNFNGGSLSNNSLTSINLNLNSSNPSAFHLFGGCNLNGDIASGQSVELTSASLSSTSSFSNNGTLTLDGNYPSLSAGTLNNYGILNFNATDGYYCTLSASLNNTSGGTVNVNSVTTFNKNPGTYINDGTFSIISGKTLTVNNGAPIFNQNSSNFTGNGTLSLSNTAFTFSGGTLNQLTMSSGTFNFNGGSLSNNSLTSINLNLDSSNQSAFHLYGGCNLNGDIASGQSVELTSASLSSTGSFSNNGTLTLDGNYPSLSAGTLNNYGILNFSATDGYNCTFSANLNNTSGGTVNINSNTTFNKNPGIYTNDGVFSIISGKTLTVNNGAPIFNQNSSNFSCSGTLSLSNVTFTYSGGTLAQLNMSSGTFNFNGGSLSNNSLTSINLNLNSSNPSAFHLFGGCNLNGDIASGQSVELTSASLSSTNSFSNNGTLTLDGNYPSLSAGTLNNYGILNFNATDGYYCTLSASLNNTSGGTVNVNSVTTFNKNPGTYINDGTFSIISGKTLTVNNGAPTFNQNSSNFTGSGTLSLSNTAFTFSGGTLNQLTMSGGTFNFNGGTIPNSSLSSLTLNLNSASPSFFNLYGTCNLFGNIAGGQTVQLNGATLNAAGDVTNSGIITANGSYPTLNVSGLLTNSGIINSNSNSGGYYTTVGANINNAAGGTININELTHFNKNNATYNNSGTINIADGKTLSLENGTLTFNQNAGTFTSNGNLSFPNTTFTLNGGDFNCIGSLYISNATFNFSRGTINQFTMDSGTFNYSTGTGNGPFQFNSSTLNLSNTTPATFKFNGTCGFSGNIAGGQTIQLNGATLNAAGDVTNSGIITANGSYPTLNVSGLLTNSGIINSNSNSGGYYTTVGANINNAAGGTININELTHFNKNNATYNNSGTINIADGKTLSLENGTLTFNQNAGTFTSNGNLNFPNTTFTLNGGDFNCIGSLYISNSTFNFTRGTINQFTMDGGTFNYSTGTANGPFQFNNSTLNLSNTTPATFNFNNSTCGFSGNIASGQTLQLNNATLNAAGDVINNGTITASSSYPKLNVSGLLTNNGTVNANSNSGGYYAAVSASINNAAGGTININELTYFNKDNVTYNNYGTINIANGKTLSLQNSSLNFNQNAGTFTSNGNLNFPNTTFTLNGGDFTCLGSLYISNSTFNFTRGTINQFTMDGGTFNYSTGTANGPFQFNNSTLNLSNTTPATFNFNNSTCGFSGNIASGQTLQLNNATLNAAGDVINNGTITASSSYPKLNVSGLLTNNGTVNANSNSGGYYAAVSASINNATGGTININELTYFNKDNATYNNYGTITIANGKTLNIQSNGSSTFTQQDPGTVTGGGYLNFNSVTINAAGNMTAIVTNNGSILNVGNSPGILNITGNYSQNSAGKLNIELGGDNPGSGYDQINITGTATLAGTLQTSLINSITPHIAQQFQFMNYGSRSGNFGTINLPAQVSGLSFRRNTDETDQIILAYSIATKINIYPTTVNVTEGGSADTYYICLSSQPVSTVTVNLSHDGQITTPDSVVFSAADWMDCKSVSVTAINDNIYEGSRADTIKHTAASSDINFNNISFDVTVNITDVGHPRATVNVTGGDFQYDGNSHAAVVSVTGSGGVAVSGNTTVTYSGSGSTSYGPISIAPTSAGTYLVEVQFTSADPLYDSNSGSANINITKKPASVTPNPTGKTFGQSDPALSGTLAGFLSIDNVSAAYSRTAGENVSGSPYVISAALSPAVVLGNYNISYNTASFTINPAPATISLVTLDLNQAYTATPRTVGATTNPNGLSYAVSYKQNGIEVSPVAAGSYDVTASVTNSNYTATPATGTLHIVIDTASVTFKTNPEGLNLTVDGTVYSYTQTLTLGQYTAHTVSVDSIQAGSTGTRYSFSGWSDGGGISHSYNVGTAANQTLIANYTTQYSLTLSTNPLNVGSINGGTSGTYYNKDSVLNLTAVSPFTDGDGNRWGFINWSGDSASSNNPLFVAMSGAKNLTANYTRLYRLTVNIAGTGSGTTDPSSGYHDYPANTVVTLTATPNATSTFAGWTGDLDSPGANTVTMIADKAVTATFAATSSFAGYSALNDFSTVNGNPNGVWSYGWMPTNFSSFNLFVNHSAVSWYGWGGDGTPAIWHNLGGPTNGVPTGWLSLHPGPGTEPSVLRWKAPATGIVDITGEFLAGDWGVMAVAVRQNNQPIWQASDSGKFNLTKNVTTGDTIDFAVYGGYGWGNTPISALIKYQSSDTVSVNINNISPSSPSDFGQTVSFTVIVSPTSGTTAPTGTVTLYDGTNLLGSSTLSGSSPYAAVIATSSLMAGIHNNINAVYSGDGLYQSANSSPVTYTVNKIGSSVLVTSSANPAVYGHSLVWYATVSSINGNGVPGGTVQFKIDGTNSGVPVALDQGKATYPIGSWPSWPNFTGVITAEYSGDSNFNGSTGSLAGGQTMTKATLIPSITIEGKVYDGTIAASVKQASLIGVIGSDQVSIDLSQASAALASPKAGNSVTVYISGLALSGPDAYKYSLPANVTSSAVVTPRPLTLAANGANKIYDGSTAATVNFTDDRLTGDNFSVHYSNANFADKDAGINKTINITGLNLTGTDAACYSLASTTATAAADITQKLLTITADPKTRIYGAANPDFTVTSNGLATGDTLGSLNLGFVLSTTAAANSPVSTYPITFSGGLTSTTNYNPINYVNSFLSVTKVSTTTTVISSGNTAMTGQSITYTATVAPVQPGNGTPTGSVQFKVDGANFGSSVALVNGSVDLAITISNSGLHNISAVYSGDDNFNTSTSSNWAMQVIVGSIMSISQITLPAQANMGDIVHVTWKVTNTGAGSTYLTLWNDRIVLSRNSTYGDADDTSLVAVPHTGALVPNQSYNAGADIVLPNGAAGDCTIFIVTDPANGSNNVSIGTAIKISAPDLTVDSIGIPATGTFGQGLDVTWTVTNKGDLPTNKAWSDRIWLSTAAVLNNPTELLTSPIIRSYPLAAGESYTKTAQVTLPLSASSQAGTWYIIVQTDILNSLPESDETNNANIAQQISLEMPPLPDLVVNNINITGDPSVSSGSLLTITWEDFNAGSSATSGDWTDNVMVVNSGTGETLLNTWVSYSQSANQAIDPQKGHARSTTYRLPDGSRGTGQIKVTVTVDGHNSVIENNAGGTAESNNTSDTTVTSTMSNYPDMTIQNITFPAQVQSGQQVSVNWNLVNSGDAASSGTWTENIYLSADQVIGGDDQLLQTTQFKDPLGSGGGSIGQTAGILIPSGISGNRYVVVRVTSDTGAYDANPGNNAAISSQAMQIQGPDLTVTAITGPASGISGESIQVSWTVTNVGGHAASGSWADKVLLSTDNTSGNGTLLTSVAYNGTLEINGSYNQTKNVVLPSVIGPYYIVVKTNADQLLAEASYSNNIAALINPTAIAAPYSATVAADLHIASNGTIIPLHGHAVRTSDNTTAAANKQVTVRVLTKGTRRVINAVTDGNGDFKTSFVPLQYEAGQYQVGADHPLVTKDPVQDNFQIIGMSADPAQFSLQLVPNIPVTGSITLSNLSDIPLTAVTASVNSLFTNLTTSFNVPAGLPGSGSVKINYSISANDASQTHGTIVLHIVTAEGANLDIPITLTVIPLVSKLSLNPGFISSGLLRGQQYNFSVELSNIGGAPSGPIQIQVPSFAWMSLGVVSPLPSLAPGEKTTVTLLASPQADQKDFVSNRFTGNIAMNGKDSGVSLGFDFTGISNATGSLQVTVTDDYTFYAAGNPKVEGANVLLRDPYDNSKIVAQGKTDATGVVTLNNVAEGSYLLDVSAEKHGTAKQTYYIKPGTGIANETTVFIAREVITYSWSVVPTEIQDQYQIQLVSTFETNVPVPVVTIDAPDQIPEMAPGASTQMDITITNHGLIAAENVVLELPPNTASYTFSALTTKLGVVPAKSTITVPMTVQRKSTALNLVKLNYTAAGIAPAAAGISPMDDPPSDPCVVYVGTLYDYKCGADKVWHRSEKGIDVYANVCAMAAIADALAVLGGWIPSIGGGVSGPGASGTPGTSAGTSVAPPSIKTQNCDPCLNKKLIATFDCVTSFFAVNDWIKCGYGVAKTADKVVSGGVSVSAGVSAMNATVTCVIAAAKVGGKAVPIAGWLYTIYKILKCTYSFYTVCDGVGGGAGGGGGGGGGPGPTSASLMKALIKPAADTGTGFRGPMPTGLSDAEKLMWERGVRLQEVLDAYTYLYGSDSWQQITDDQAFEDWLTSFQGYNDVGSEDGYRISSGERQSLLALKLPNPLTAVDINAFLDRWNRSMDYWNQGIYNLADVPSGQSSDFIAIDVFVDKWTAAGNALDANSLEGFDEPIAALNDAKSKVNDWLSGQSGVCAKVKIEIDQKAVMTRAAFLGTLQIQNGDTSGSLTGIKVDINITDAQGNPANAMFGFKAPELAGLSAVDGNGVIAAGGTGTAKYTFVPTRDAAPTAPTIYKIGGTLRYTNPQGQVISNPLFPASITVYPDALLKLDYFQQRDVIGDDPFTDVVEPSEQFTLGLLVTNIGHGTAKNLQITSAQPKIIENKKGLLIDFKIIGTQMGNQEVDKSLEANFNNISPSQTKEARWLLISSLMGRFVDYKATFEHITDLGAQNTSLIDSVAIHELIHTVKADRPGDDNQCDFLVNDHNSQAMPDTLYLSDGTVAPVNLAANPKADRNATPDNRIVQLTANMTSGWCYIRLPDPGAGFKLVKVLRSDNKEIKVGDNTWQTNWVFAETNQSYNKEPRLHLLDYNGTGSYTLTYVVNDTTPPSITDISQVTPNPTTTAVSSIDVTFSEPIDVTTFDYQDVSLTKNGGANLINSSVTVNLVSGSVYRIGNLAAMTGDDGNYTLTVDSTHIQDYGLNNGTNSMSTAWAKGVARPVIVSLGQGITSLRNTAVSSVVIVFSKAIKEDTFTRSALTLTLNGGSNLISEAVSIVSIDGTSYTIGGLGNLTAQDGNYVLTADASSVQDTAGNAGLGAFSLKWTKISVGPVLTAIEQLATNPRNIVVPSLNVTFSDAINSATFDWQDITLNRDGGANLITKDVVVQKVSGTEYQISNFNWVVGQEGTYTLNVSAVGIQDMAGNSGSGSLSTTWVMDTTPPVVPTNLGITPDNGVSTSDNLTNILSLNVHGTLGEKDLNVQLIDADNTNELNQGVISGTEFNLPVIFTSTGSHRIQVHLVDKAANVTDTYLDIVVDLTPPKVDHFNGVPATATQTPLAALDVVFSEQIGTFTTNNLTATKNGTPLDLSALKITTADSVTFHLAGLPVLSNPEGSYALIIDLSGVKDVAGNTGAGQSIATWQVGSSSIVRPTVLQTIIQDGHTSSNVGMLSVRFSSSMNIPSLITDGTITAAVRLARLDPADNSKIVEITRLQTDQFTYDASTNSLTWRLNGQSGGTNVLPLGNYALQLDSSILADNSGNLLLGNGNGNSWFGLPVFSAAVNLQSGGSNIQVSAYSVPTVADWNGDKLPDLIVGEQTSSGGKIRVYLNTGTKTLPVFNSSFYVQSGSTDLTVPTTGCLGVFPRVVDWNGDGKKDLILGLADGTMMVYLNSGTDSSPAFGSGSNIQCGPTGSKVNINVGARATPEVTDWNNDGKPDLVVGSLDGNVRVYLNQSSSGAPDLASPIVIKEGSSDLSVPSGRSSVNIVDLNNDGLKDLLLGNTDGQLFFYPNIGTEISPAFNSHVSIKGGGAVIDLEGTPRSRPFACDFNNDGVTDILLGSFDGLVRLYSGQRNNDNYVSTFAVAAEVVQNQAPVAADQSVFTPKSIPLVISLVATDKESDPLTFAVVTGPANGALTEITGNTLTYSPKAGFVGLDSFTFKANDGKADSNVATVHITVTSAQKWYLESSGHPVMDKNGTHAGSVTVAATGDIIWTSDQTAETDVVFSTGTWKIYLKTTNWSSTCSAQIGNWDGTVFTAFRDAAPVKGSYSNGILTINVNANSDKVSIKNKLALRILNGDTVSHEINTDGSSYLTSPASDPGFPLFEMSAGMLFSLGIIGLLTFVGIRRRRSLKSQA